MLAEHIEHAYTPRTEPGELADVPHGAWTPWGTVPAANDNKPPLMIGLTGRRNVGKTTIANLLEEEFGFERVHAFDSGKIAAAAWFDAVGGDGHEMVFGSLKDVPSSHLPGNVAPRFFLEKFGHFMGVTMGVEWTLAMEISLAKARNPNAPIVVESVVYEAPWFRSAGGKIVRVNRLNHDGPIGIESDAVQAIIAADCIISAENLSDLRQAARRMVARFNAEQ